MSWIAALAIVAGVYLVANLIVRRFGLSGSSLDHDSLLKLLERGDGSVHLIDVRSSAEYEAGHIPTALNIPHSAIGPNTLKLAKDSLLVLYSETGSRLRTARSMLHRKGYTNVVDFGALRRWKAPIATGSDPGSLAGNKESTPGR